MRGGGAGFFNRGAIVVGFIPPPTSTFGFGEPSQTILNTAAGATDLLLANYFPY
jgi:hypothetical protein